MAQQSNGENIKKRTPPPSCDARTLDERGEWTDANVTTLYARWICPLWNYNAYTVGKYWGTKELQRFDCGRSPSVRYGRLQLSECHPPALLDLLPRRSTVWFIGDSVAYQHESSFACRLLHEAHQRGIRTSLDRRPAKHHREKWPWEPLVNPRDRSCSSAHCLGVRLNGSLTFQTCWVSAGGHCYTGEQDSVKHVSEVLISAGVVQPADTIIMNEGLHHNDAEFASARVASLASQFTNASSPLHQARQHGIRFLWRETSPQAFPGSPTGAWPGAKFNYSARSCTPVERPKRPTALVKDLRMLEEANLPVVPIYNLTVGRWDAHLERRTRYAATRPLDCTHFCEPSGVLDAWVDATVLAIANAYPPHH